MMKYSVCFISFLFFIVLRTNFAAIPPYIKICKHNSDVDKCLIENIEACKPYLEKGIPGLYLPPLHPFQIESIELTNGNLHIKIEDFKLFHLDKFEIQKFDIDLDKIKIDFELLFPYVEQEAKYEINGKFLVMELNGAGDHYGNASEIVSHGSFTGKREMIDGKEHLLFEKFPIKLDVKGPLYMYFYKLFGENEELTRTTNEILNENSKEALEEVKEMLEDAISELFGAIFKNIFLKYTVDELFPK